MRNLILCFAFIIAGGAVFGQKNYKGEYTDVMIVEFEAPYEQITVDYDGDELSMPLTSKCKISNRKRKSLTRDILVPTTIVNIAYEIQSGKRVVRSIEADIDEGGIVRIEGVFEGMDGDAALVDGYRVTLSPQTVIVGGRGNKCDCKGELFPSFSDRLLHPGRYFITLEGKMNEEGVVIAGEAEACKNHFTKNDQALRDVVEQSYNPANLSEQPKPADMPFEVSLPLHNGNIVIGQYAYKLHDDLMLQGYVNSVGEKLVPEYQKNMSVGDASKIDFRFYVIDNPIPNAFAFPNGMIFVHTGILDIMDNEAELAIVLGHEIAHVTYEHGRERYESGRTMEVTTRIAGNFLNLDTRVNTMLGNLGLSEAINQAVKETYSAIRPDGLANVMNPQPARETQADRVGIQYALLAGYDIREAVNFWNKMRNLTGDPSFKSQMTSHVGDMLASNNFRSSNPLDMLGEVGLSAVSKLLLDNIYTSHPKAKARAQALNQMIITVYAGENLDGLRKYEDDFAQYVGGGF